MTRPLNEYARQLRASPTEAEQRLWQRLRRRQIYGCKFRRQQVIAGYIVDFVCHEMRLIIELDGGQHADQIQYDQQRTGQLNQQGYHVIRFWNDDVMKKLDSVLEKIVTEVACCASQPP